MLMDVRVSELGNGIRVISSSMPNVESATIGIWVAAGSRYEPIGLCGASHFVEHMLFKGTKKRSAKAISEAVEGRGGYLNAFTQEESTCYHAHVPADHSNETLDILADMYLNAVFDAKELEKEKGVVIEEIMMGRDQPQQLVQDILGEIVWKDHPLGRPIGGKPETVRSFTRESLLEYKRATYVPGNTLFAFAGRLEHDRCVDAVKRHVGRLKPVAPPTCPKATRAVGQSPLAAQAKDIEQVHLAIGTRLPFGADDARRYALRVLNTILGENMSSRLFQLVREKHGLAYYVHSSFQLLGETGILVISAGLDRKRYAKAVNLIIGEIVRMKERQVSVGELRRAKDYVCGQIRLGLESTRHQMLWIGDNIMAHGKFIPPEDVMKAVSAVSADEVQSLAVAIARRSRTSAAIVAPGLSEAHKSGLMDSLARL